ncbi:hypothetical protein [Flavobacterium sp.]|jgi:hypothetical protein|uniref:hypothetical protein n=1 Tax=Flavobacterium sp. TaxID=239 RepID=UPI0037C094EF
MKVEKEYTIYYIVHAISILDLDLLTQILRPLANSVSQKVEVSQILFEFERVFKDVLSPSDTHFDVSHGYCQSPICCPYKYTFVANSSGINFSLKFRETKKGMIYIDECRGDSFEKQIIVLKFKGYQIDVPF